LVDTANVNVSGFP